MPIPLFLVGLAKKAAMTLASSAANKLVEELMNEPSDEEIQEDEQRKRKKQVIAIGVVCFLLGGLVASSGTWYALQSSQSSEQIIALEELEKYEKARDAGLQALEYYVIQNPNSPYISQAKDLIRAYKGKE